MDRSLFEALFGIRRTPASSIITRINLFQRIWNKLPNLIRQQFAPEGNIPLKVLMVNFKGIPSLESALLEYKDSRVFPEDYLWLDQLDSLKQALLRDPKARLIYEDLQKLNKKVQEQFLSRS